MKHLLPFIALLLLVSCSSKPNHPADSAQDSGHEMHSTLTFNDGSAIVLANKYLNYPAIDSIRCTRHSFEATYHSCGKGNFNFQKQDLKHQMLQI